MDDAPFFLFGLAFGALACGVTAACVAEHYHYREFHYNAENNTAIYACYNPNCRECGDEVYQVFDIDGKRYAIREGGLYLID